MSDWISVDDRLPDMGQPVIEWGAHEYPTTAYRVNTHNGFRWRTYSDGEVIAGVTHWMPLPEPPSGDKDD